MKVLTYQLTQEWHSAKNGALLASQVTAGSRKKVWWNDSLGHEWQALVSARSRGAGCPICAGKIILPGFNDLQTLYPKLALEWDRDKNTCLPTQVGAGTHRKAWWSGSQCTHNWESSIVNRVKGAGCPYCAGKLVEIGVQDIFSTHPDIAKELHPTKNGLLETEKLSAKSSKIVWWQDSFGHEWETTPYKRSIGQGCPICSGSLALKNFNDLLSLNLSLASEWHPTKNTALKPEHVTLGSGFKAVWICKEGHEWVAKVKDRTRGTGCPQCKLTQRSSKAEEEIYLFLTLEKSLKIEKNNRTILDGKEIDLYLPDNKFGIEFNGLYWHTERADKSKNYHYDKWLAAKEAGVQLIQIWEDDWDSNKELILNSLSHKLGISKQEKLYARKTSVHPMTVKEAKAFLSVNHIQGFASGSYYLALCDSLGQIKALMVVRKEHNGIFNIIRYATNTNVVGGFTKLLSYTIKTYNPKKIITFADHTMSNGGLYENNGFIADKELAPDYMYVVAHQRKHKFGYRLNRFKNDPNLIWQEDMSERQLAELNNIPRIWDAGKTRYVLDIAPLNPSK